MSPPPLVAGSAIGHLVLQTFLEPYKRSSGSFARRWPGPMGLAYGRDIRLAAGIIGFLCTTARESSILYIRIPLSIGPGLCWMLDLNFREFLFHALG